MRIVVLFLLALLVQISIGQIPSKPYPEFSKETIRLGELTKERSCFDVHYYELNIGIDPETKSIDGTVSIGATIITSTKEIQLDLDQRMEILAITIGGEKVKYKRNNPSLFVTLPRKFENGELLTIIIHYRGSPKVAKRAPWLGGTVWSKDSSGVPFCGIAVQGDGAHLWFPCKDHASDEPDSAKMVFSTPDTSLMVISNGRLTNKELIASGVQYTWEIHNPINVYDITYYIGDYVLIADTLQSAVSNQTLDCSYYPLKQNETIAKKHFPQVKRHIRVLEELFGAYPWYNDGYKLVECPYKGMEHQSAVAYGNGYVNDLNETDDYIILHETAHEWFGNAITANDYAHIWLQEGITTYSEALYLEKVYGEDAAKRHLMHYRNLLKNQYPIVGPVDRRYFDAFDGDVYFKAAWVLHAYRQYLHNDDLFFSIQKAFFARHKGVVCETNDFIALATALVGSDQSPYFNTYLNQASLPKLEFFLDNDTLHYRMTGALDGLQIPVQLLEETSEHLVQTIEVTQDWQQFDTKGNKLKFDRYTMLLELTKVQKPIQ